MSNLEVKMADPSDYIEQLMEAACMVLKFTGPLELKYKVSEDCTISVSLKKE